MDFSKRGPEPQKHALGITMVIAFHAIVIYALVTGLGKKIVDVIKQPIETPPERAASARASSTWELSPSRFRSFGGAVREPSSRRVLEHATHLARVAVREVRTLHHQDVGDPAHRIDPGPDESRILLSGRQS